MSGGLWLKRYDTPGWMRTDFILLLHHFFIEELCITS